MVRRRRGAAPFVVVALLVGLLGVLVPPPPLTTPAGAATTSTTLPFAEVRDLLVDPATGRVFVSGDDGVAVHEADGSPVTTLGGLGGAAGLDIEGDRLYVAETGEGSISAIDLATLTTSSTWPVGDLQHGIVVQDGTAWFLGGPGLPTTLSSVDLDTGVVAASALGLAADDLLEVPGDTGHLVVHARGANLSTVRRIDLRGASPTVVASAPYDANTTARDVGAYGDGSGLVVAGRSQALVELDPVTLQPTGSTYAASSFPNGVSTTPAHGGLVVSTSGSTYDVGLRATPVGTELPAVSEVLARRVVPGAVDVATDGDRAYTVTVADPPTATTHLEVVDLRPRVASALPSSVVVDVPTPVLVDGEHLASTSTVSVGGLPAPFEVVSAERLVVTMPAGLTPGPHDLVVRTPIGTASIGLTATPNTGATLAGTVVSPTGSPAGLEVTVSGSALPAPTTTTTDGTGSFAVAGLPWGDDYQVAVHDPSGEAADQVLHHVTATPNATRALAIHLSPAADPTSAASVAVEVDLEGPGRALHVHPGTGLTFVSAGDEVMVVDEAARVLARVLDLPGAAGLASIDDTVFVNLTEPDAVAAVDATTLSVGEVHDLGIDTNGSLAVAGDALWTAPASGSGPARLHRVDPATGSVTVPPGAIQYRVGLTSIPGAPTQLLTWRYGGGSSVIDRLEALPTGVTVLDQALYPAAGPGPLAVSAARDRVWTGSGSELLLSTLSTTGTQRAGEGEVTWTEDGGGRLAVGGAVHQLDTEVQIAALGDDGDQGPSPLSTFVDDGHRLLRATEDGRLQLWDLTPRIDAVSPDPLVEGIVDRATVAGFALGGATSVEVGGIAADLEVLDPSTLSVAVPSELGPGTHDVVVQTPDGDATSSLTVVADTGAELAGAALGPDGPAAGVELTLSGGGLPAPIATTTDLAGTFALDGIPLGTYRFEVHDPMGRYADLAVTNLRLVPNDLTHLPLDLSPAAPVADGSQLARVPLAGAVQDLVVDGDADRAYLTTASELLVVDTAGRLVGRVTGLDGAHGIAVLDGAVFVNRGSAGTITEIDPTSLEVVGSSSTDGPTNGSLVAAADRLWFTAGDSAVDAIVGLDPTTGAIGPIGTSYANRAELAGVVGADDRILSWSRSTARSIALHDVSGAAGQEIGEAHLPGTSRPPGRALGSALHGRVWLTDGTELRYPSMTASDTTYPAGVGGVSFDPAHGGLVLFGTVLSEVGAPQALSEVGDELDAARTGLAPGGIAAFVATYDGSLVLWDLRPRVEVVDPNPTSAGRDGVVDLVGPGMGLVTGATVDDVAVSVTPVDAGRVRLAIPAAVTDRPLGTELPVTITSRYGTVADAASVVVDRIPPGPPTDVTAEVLDGSDIRVEWGPPADPGTAPVTFVVEVAGQVVEVPAHRHWASVWTVPPGEHVATVRATSLDGASAAVAADPVTVVAADPEPPTEVALVPGPGTATLSWEPPGDTGSAPVTGFEIRLAGGDEAFTVPWHQLSAEVHGLAAPTTLEIRTLTSHGASAWVASNAATPAAPAALFPDVGVGHPFYWEIRSAIEQGLTTGYPDGGFHPTAPTSRQAAIAFLWRQAGEPAGPFPDPGFPDVPTGHQFRTAIAWAAAEGITTGYPDGGFHPTAPVSRQAFVAFQWRVAGSPPGPFPDPGFTDVGPGHPFEDAISWAAAEEITTGYADGGFHPTAPVSRQAAVAFLTRPTWPDWQPLP